VNPVEAQAEGHGLGAAMLATGPEVEGLTGFEVEGGVVFPHVEFTLLDEDEFVGGDDAGGVHDGAAGDEKAGVVGFDGAVGAEVEYVR